MLGSKFRLFIGVIAVLAAVTVIIFLLNKKSGAEGNREQILIVLDNIAQNAQTHYNRANSFEGWEIPGSLRIEEIGTFREKVTNNKVMITVVGNEIGKNGISNVNIESTINGNDVTLKIRN